MKSTIRLMMILTLLFPLSCMDMFNDLAEEFNGYKYFLAVVNGSSEQRVSTISLDAEGNPSPVAQKATSAEVTWAAAHPSGDYLYVVSSATRELFSFRVLKNGSLEQMPGTTTISSNGNDDPDRIEIDPSGRYLYIFSSWDGAFNPGKIFMFQINIDGSLISRGEESLGQYVPINMAIDSSGSYLFVVHEDSDGFSRISMYQIGSNGKLSYIDSENENSYDYFPFDVKVHPNGQYVYVSGADNSTSASSIYVYQISNTGLSLKETISNGPDSSGYAGLIEIHPNGKYLYATSPGEYKMYDYRISNTGSLETITPSGIYFTTSGARESIIHPKENYMFISHSGSSMIVRIKINDDGSLGLKDDYLWGGGAPSPYTDYSTEAMGLVLIRKNN